MRVSIEGLMDGEQVLFGVAMGRACLAKLMDKVDEPDNPEPVFLDFGSVASATVSFLREGPLGFRDLLRSRSSNLYPVFANLEPAVEDSLGEFLAAQRDAVFACDLSGSDTAGNPRVLGQLEAKQRLTFEAVRDLGEVTAGELAKQREGPEAVGVTAWNNRLAALALKGLVMEFRSGRSKVYKPALGEAR